MHRPRFRIAEGDGIVDRDLALPGELHFDSGRIADESSFEGDEVLAGQPGFTAVGAASQHHVDVIPVIAAVLARFAVGEHGPLFRDDDAGDAIENVSVLASLEEIDLFEERFRGDAWKEAGEPNNRGDGPAFHGWIL